MGKNLHHTIVPFFEKSLSNHNKVIRYTKDNSHDYYLYSIERANNLSTLIVLLADEYEYTLNDYYQRPQAAKENVFICVIRPEADFSYAIIDIAKEDKVGIGKLSTLIGALNYDKHWLYVPPERKKD